MGNLLLLVPGPIVTLFLVWTNAHHLYWTSATLVKSGTLSVLALPMGHAFWLSMAYHYSLLLIGALFVAETFIRPGFFYRKQTGAMLIGALAPWGQCHFPGGSQPLSSPRPDTLRFCFHLPRVYMGSVPAVFRGPRVPVAQATAIEGMSDRVMVLDANDRVVDLNPAARCLINRPISEISGRSLAQVLSDLADRLSPSAGNAEGKTFPKLKRLDPNVRVLLSIGYSRDGKAKEILESGVMGFIQKPYRVNTLLSKVGDLPDLDAGTHIGDE